MFKRLLENKISKINTPPFVKIIFGARQTGKTTLLKKLFPNPDIYYDLSNPIERFRHLSNPDLFIRECEAIERKDCPSIVVVDEAQTVPSIFDAVQYLFDRENFRWQFILSGSSAKKIRTAGVNLLPGRSILYKLYPLTSIERPSRIRDDSKEIKSFILPVKNDLSENTENHVCIEERLAFGEMPGIVSLKDQNQKGEILKSYVSTYIEEEIRKETSFRNLAPFVNFLRLSASESGNSINYSKIAKEAGVTAPTIKSFYQILEDIFIGFNIHAYTKSPRKNLLSTPKFFYFDIGVRHAAAGFTPSLELVNYNPGSFFEQWVAAELWKRINYRGEGSLYYFRTKDGAEIDFILETEGKTIPIEVKWTETPDISDARHLVPFLNEKPEVQNAFVVCRCPRPIKLSEKIMAIPWQMI